jgi:protein gp37
VGEQTSIAWCHHTFNCWWGCSNVSPGCSRCYAHTWAKRTGFDLWGAKGERRTFPEKHWREPLAWNAAAQRAGERRRVFCASMADVFEDHPALPPERAKLWPLIEATPWLDWLLLTKRIENVSGMVPWGESWPENVWIGTSVENQEWADERIPILLKVPAIVRFLSVEPMLGPVTLWQVDHDGPDSDCDVCGQEDILKCYYDRGAEGHLKTVYAADGEPEDEKWCRGILRPYPSVDWVICGGESGAGARRMDPEWARSLRDTCVYEGVPFLFKQTGTVLAREWGLKDSKGEDMAEWPADLQIREWPDPLGVGQGVLL